MSPKACQRLQKALESRINPKEDDIRIYPLSAGYAIHYIGQNPLPEGLTLDWQRGQWQKEDTDHNTRKQP